MASREFVFGVVESAYGTPKSSPTLGTDSFYPRLSGSNSFTMVGDPQFYEIMYGGGRAIAALTGSDQMSVTGQIETELYGAQGAFLLNLALQQVNAGGTVPWTTTEPPGDLASMTFYHAVTRSDGTIKRLQFQGCKATRLVLAGSRQQKIWKVTVGLQAQKWNGNTYDSSADPTATPFPAPAESSYPTDPFRYIDMASNITIGSGRTQIESVTHTVENKMDPRWFENRFLSLHRFLGRTITSDYEILYKPSPDDITNYQNIVVQAHSFELNNGTHTATLGFNAQNFITKLSKNLELDKVYTLKLTLKNYWDPAANAGAGADMTLTLT